MSTFDTIIARQGRTPNYAKLAFSVRISPSGAVSPIKDLTLWLEVINLARARLMLTNTLALRYSRHDAGGLYQADGVALALVFSPGIERMIGSAAHVPLSWDITLQYPTGSLMPQCWPHTKEPFNPVMGLIQRVPDHFIWNWEPDEDWQRQLRLNFPAIYL